MRVTAMKNIILTIFVLTIFVQCTTEKRCRIKYPCISGRDSIYIEKLDTVQVILPGDSIIIHTEVPCNDFELKTENAKLLASLKVVNGILELKMKEKPDTMRHYVTNTITKTIEVTKPVEVKYIPKFNKIMTWIGIGAILLILAYVGFKVKHILQ